MGYILETAAWIPGDRISSATSCNVHSFGILFIPIHCNATWPLSVCKNCVPHIDLLMMLYNSCRSICDLLTSHFSYLIDHKQLTWHLRWRVNIVITQNPLMDITLSLYLLHTSVLFYITTFFHYCLVKCRIDSKFSHL